MNKRISRDNYTLSFWARGVSVLVTDINTRAYRRLEALCIIDRGLFKQYFAKKAYEQVLDEGLVFYSDADAVKEYRSHLSHQCREFKEFFNEQIRNRSVLSLDVVETFLAHATMLVAQYNKMNFEYTNKAFLYKETNEVITGNLDLIVRFKDEVRAFMNEVFFEESGYLGQIYSILARQFSLPVSVFGNLTQKELTGLFTGREVNQHSLLRRPEAFVVIYNEEQPLEGAEATRVIQLLEERPLAHTSKIIGQIANKGTVKGRVRNIGVDYSQLSLLKQAIADMQKGEILVAETTAPELILACKKAAAIVTDMGGLMSHAAIVSRELHIPCIVGTKNATKMLKEDA